MSEMTSSRRSARVASAPVALFLVSATSLYLGAAIAVSMFDELEPGGVAWLRVSASALMLTALGRPWRTQLTRRTIALASVFGVVLAAMNTCFYLAAEQLPLGTAVAIEFLGPIVIAAVAVRTVRNGVAIAAAGFGVLLLADVRWEASPGGVGFALAAAALWAGYIVLGKRVADATTGVAGLAIGAVAGALVLAPLLVPSAAPAFDARSLLALGALVGLLSSVIPYGLDQVVLRMVTADHFALLLAILPATATIIGFLTLSQRPTGTELVGIGLVSLGVALRESSR